MSFIYSNVLFLMLIPTLVLIYLIFTKQDKLERYFSKNALEKLSISNQYFSNKARNVILFFSLIFMIIALARPVTNEKTNDVKANLTPLIIAIDVSKSMKAIDLFPNRLEFAKQKLLNILDNSKTEAIGIILFAKSAFLLSAVTQDFDSIKVLINNLDTGINFDNGTNIYSTLETTKQLLKNFNSRNLILLTDGGDKNNFNEEINFAKENNINIYVLALATQKGSAIKEENGDYLTDKKGNIVNVNLNNSIKELALNTNGGYIEFSLDNSDINQILNDINTKSKKEIFENKKYKTYTELFYYPLTLAILLLLMAFSSFPNFRKNKNSLLLFLSIFLFSNEKLLAFSILDFNTIKEAIHNYENKNYKESSKNFENLDSNEFRDYNLANSLYKENNFKEAINLYENIKTSSNDLEFKRLHNLGNAYAKNNDFEKAIKNYENALKLKNDKETKENLELLKKALEKKDDKKNQKDKNENNQNQEKKEQKENKQTEKQESKSENKNSIEEEKNQEKISMLEEEKWIKEIENQKINSLLKKMESSKEDSISNPW